MRRACSSPLRRSLVLALSLACALVACVHRRARAPSAPCIAALARQSDALAAGTLPPLRAPAPGVAWVACDAHAALVAAVERVVRPARAHAAATRAMLDPSGAVPDPAARAWLASERFDDFERAALCDRFDLPPAAPGALTPRAALHVAPVAGVSNAIAARAVLPDTPLAERRRLGITLALLASDLQRGDTPALVGISERLLAFAHIVLRPTVAQQPAFTAQERARLRAAVAAQASPWRVMAAEFGGVARAYALLRDPAYARERLRGRAVDDGTVGEACAAAVARVATLDRRVRERSEAYRDVLTRMTAAHDPNPVARAIEPAYGPLATMTERLASTQARLRELAAQVEASGEAAPAP